LGNSVARLQAFCCANKNAAFGKPGWTPALGKKVEGGGGSLVKTKSSLRFVEGGGVDGKGSSVGAPPVGARGRQLLGSVNVGEIRKSSRELQEGESLLGRKGGKERELN